MALCSLGIAPCASVISFPAILMLLAVAETHGAGVALGVGTTGTNIPLRFKRPKDTPQASPGNELDARDANDGAIALLFDAVTANNVSEIKRLAHEAGADVHARRGPFRATPLVMACDFGLAAAAHALIDLGADVNAATSQSLTPLHAACGIGICPSIAKLILACSKASLNTRTLDGDLPIHIAAFVAGDVSLVCWLIQEGAHVDARLCALLHASHSCTRVLESVIHSLQSCFQSASTWKTMNDADEPPLAPATGTGWNWQVFQHCACNLRLLAGHVPAEEDVKTWLRSTEGADGDEDQMESLLQRYRLNASTFLTASEHPPERTSVSVARTEAELAHSGTVSGAVSGAAEYEVCWINSTRLEQLEQAAHGSVMAEWAACGSVEGARKVVCEIFELFASPSAGCVLGNATRCLELGALWAHR